MKKSKVLIIDDESALRNALKKALKHEEYRLYFAENGEEGLTILGDTTPDLIFLDLKMPVMDGFKFLSRIKIQPDDPYLIIVMTGHGDDKEVQKCFQQGVNFFLRKPLSMVELCCLARRCIDLKKIEIELRDHRNNLEKIVEKRTRDLAEQIEFQQTLIDAIPTPVFFKDTRRLYIGCNAAFEEAIGLSRKDIIGLDVHDLTTSDLADRHTRIDRRILRKGGEETYESSAIYADGSTRDVIVCKAPFKNPDNRVAGLIGTMIDISERTKAEGELNKRSEELEEVNTALRVMLQQVNKAKEEMEDKIIANVKNRILPHIIHLEEKAVGRRNRVYLEAVKSNIDKITSTFSKRLTSSAVGLSPKELQVADFVKMGKTNKETARLLGVSQNAVEFHRNNLRKKLGLLHKRINLRTHLMTME